MGSYKTVLTPIPTETNALQRNGINMASLDNEQYIVRCPYGDIDIPNSDIWSYVASCLRNNSSSSIIDYNSKETYTSIEIADKVENVAAHYQYYGIGPEVKVAYLAKNSVKSLVSYAAIYAAGATAVPITLAYSSTDEDFIALANMTECTFCICDSAYIRQILAFKENQNKCKEIFLINGEHEQFVSIESILNNKEERSGVKYKILEIDPVNAVACLIFTSGTTGMPKAIIHTHESFLNTLITTGLSPMRTITGDDMFLLAAPFVHVSGTAAALTVFLTGATAVVLDPTLLSPQTFVDIIEKYKITALFSFPTAVGRLIKLLNSSANLSSIRSMLLAGSAIGDSLAQLLLNRFSGLTTLRNAYGMSEVMGITTATLVHKTDVTTCGVPFPNSMFKIIDCESGKPLGRNKVGEIMLWSKAMMKGYLNSPRETNAVLEKDGFLHSGDLGCIDENGNLRVLDRIKSMIKCLDAQVSPSEIENMLLKHESVREVAVVGIPSSDYGEAPAACVVLVSGVTPSENLKQQLASLISKTCHVSKHLYGGVHFLDVLPKTTSGKVVKKELLRTIEGKVNKSA